MDVNLIERLARLCGVGDAYHDYRGELRYFTLETKIAILRAMGAPVDDAAALAEELTRRENGRWRALLPPVAAANRGRIGVELNIAAVDFGSTFTWSVDVEHGKRNAGTRSTADCPEVWRGEVGGSWITRRRFDLPLDLPPGRHTLEVRLGAGSTSRCALLISPERCYEPQSIRDGQRLWGVAVQLYTVRSRANWGIGDFSDLETMIRWLAPRGAGFIGLNPLHALAPSDPDRASPYSASNRHFLNVLYIAIPAVPEYAASDAARARAAEPPFAARLQALRETPLVDYRGVMAAKLEILEILFREFRLRHLGVGTERAEAFKAFVAAGGTLLELHARFDAIDEYCCARRGSASGWLSWPEEFQDPDGRAASQFAQENAERIEFHLYLQWLAHEQLAHAQALARELAMPIGLYGDYAVGTHPSGSETWTDRASFCLGAEVGAPPDPLALKGQGWGLPAPDPAAMTSDRLEGFSSLIRDNMRYYGALRLDHVMSLFRLWWVPAGRPPTEGAYVHYPLHELLTAVCLESARHACVVVGEDLGVVPDEMRRAMPEFGLYHYKVMLFEQDNGRFRAPEEYARQALATVTTHDMPTLRSFWEGRDIELRRGLDLYPSAELENSVREARDRDRVALLSALDQQELASNLPAPAEPFTAGLANALHTYLARSSAALAAIQLEDLLGMSEPVNVPGTHREYPNWQRKLCADIEDAASNGDLDRCFEGLCSARRGR